MKQLRDALESAKESLDEALAEAEGVTDVYTLVDEALSRVEEAQRLAREQG